MKTTTVILGRRAEKDIRRLPIEIRESLRLWIQKVMQEGLTEVRKTKGYHDEPLKGLRRGQRSIRLNRSYRAIYTESHTGNVEIVTIIEVNKHRY